MSQTRQLQGHQKGHQKLHPENPQPPYITTYPVIQEGTRTQRSPVAGTLMEKRWAGVLLQLNSCTTAPRSVLPRCMSKHMSLLTACMGANEYLSRGRSVPLILKCGDR